MSDNKITIEALLTLNKLSKGKQREIAAKLNLPDNTQKDLLFMSAILVSTGTNKNGATFLGSELVKARGTITQKALDIEHEEQKIIGHITSALYMDQQGNVIDDEALFKDLASEDSADKATAKVDKMAMDIGIVCIVYRDRFPDLAKEIEEGSWKVSMECYYDDFDLKIGEVIVPRSNVAAFAKLDQKVNEDIKLVVAGRSMGTSRVSRVLRGIRFCGVGIVKNPANERSIIMEAAAENIRQTLEKEGLDEALREAATLAIDTEEAILKFDESTDTEVIQVATGGFFLLKNGTELLPESYFLHYKDAAKEAIRRASLDKEGNKYYVVSNATQFAPRQDVEINETSEVTLYRTNEIGDIVETHDFTGLNDKEAAHNIHRWGPEDQAAGICASFERFKKDYQTSKGSMGRIVATHWCKMFNKPCPVFGADAHDPSCLRNRYSHMVKEDEIFGDKTIQAPFNPRVPVEETTLIENDAQVLEVKPLPLSDGEPMTASEQVVEAKEEQPTVVAFSPKKPISVKDVFVTNISKEERKALSNDKFALPESRKFPIHTAEAVKQALAIFPTARKALKASEQKEVFKRLVIASLHHGVDSADFEKSATGLVFKAGEDFSEDFGIPRLSLLPLNNREQVISAMSRYRHLKVEISDQERKQLVVNILRAAKKFDVDATSFRERVTKL